VKQAKIQIGLDIKPAKAEIGKLKDVFKALGGDLKGVFSKDLHDQVKIFENLIGGCTDRLHDLHKASQQALNPKVISNYVDQYRALSSVIARVARQQQAFGKSVTINYPQTVGGSSAPSPGYQPLPQAPQPSYTRPPRTGGGGGSGGGGDEDVGGGGGGSNVIGKLARGGMKALGAIGIGIGVHAAIEREIEHSEAGMRVRSLTGNGMVEGRSQFGFTRMDRLQRGAGIAAQGGRDMGNGEISGLVNQSERLERGFGISGEGYASAYGSARRAGSEKPAESIANAVGDAVSMKLSGSAVGEYLQQMAGYLDQMSKGVNVDEKSLRGFATSLGDMNFFRGHPERIFDAMGKLDALFKGGGNEFQNFGMYQATQEVSAHHGRTLTPSGIANRRAFGAFGASQKTLQGFRESGMPNLAKDLSASGDEIIKQYLNTAFKEATQGGRGKDSEEALQMFREKTGLEGDPASAIYQKLGRGDKLTKKEMKEYKDAQKTPAQRADDAMKTYEGSVVTFKEEVDNMKNIISKDMMDGVIMMDHTVTKFDDAVNKYISKVLGVEEKNPYTPGAEEFTKQGLKHGFVPSADEAANYAKTEEDATPLLRGIHSQQYGKPYDKLEDDQKAKVDRDVQDHLARSRNANLRKEAEHIQAYKRFKDMGKDFDPKTDAEKDVAKDADDLNPADMDAKYDRHVMSQDRFDAFINGTDDDQQKKPDQAKARGGMVGYADGGEFKTTVDDHVINSAGSKRIKAFIANIVDTLTGSGKAKADPYDELAKHAHEGNQALGKAFGGLIGFADGGDVKTTVDDHAINSAGNKRVKAFFSNLVKSVTGSGEAKADDPYAKLAEHAHEGNQAPGKAGGGSVGFSSIRGIGRGRSDMGTDTLMTGLTPGEFVVNARDASRNMLALQHANAGGKISPYADGGAVGGVESMMSALSAFPSSVKLDSGSHEHAMGANTQAIMMLAHALSGGSSGMRDVPRGPRAKYG